MHVHSASSARQRLKGVAFAVTDGPDGEILAELTGNQAQGLSIRALHDGFWCSTRVFGGCGGRLDVVAGPLRAAHFRHRVTASPRHHVTTGAGCALRDPDQAHRSYAHLQFQMALQLWLSEQGLNATIEKHLNEDGRADLHVVVEGIEHTLEVQLSPMSIETFRARDTKYRHDDRRVTWLFGENAKVARSAVASNDNITFDVASCPPNGADEARSKFGVTIGTRLFLVDAAEESRLSPLEACTFDRDGLHTPHLQAMHALIDQARDQRAKESDATARTVGKTTPPPMPTFRTRPAYRPKPPTPQVETAESKLVPRVPRTTGDPDEDPRWARWAPPLDWEPPRGIGWDWTYHLPERERQSALAFAYMTQELFESAPLGLFNIAGVGDVDLVIGALMGAGLIRRADHPLGTPRWKRNV